MQPGDHSLAEPCALKCIFLSMNPASWLPLATGGKITQPSVRPALSLVAGKMSHIVDFTMCDIFPATRLCTYISAIFRQFRLQ